MGSGCPNLLFGGFGDDVLKGLGGDDQLCGFDGDDTLNGRPGTDLCDQGAGSGSKTSCELWVPSTDSGRRVLSCRESRT